MGRDRQSQRFLSLGLESQSIFLKLCRPLPQAQVPKNLNRSHGTVKSHRTRVSSDPKAWDLAVPEIFVPGLSQRYMSKSKASQDNQSQVPGQKFHGIPVPLPVPDSEWLFCKQYLFRIENSFFRTLKEVIPNTPKSRWATFRFLDYNLIQNYEKKILERGPFLWRINKEFRQHRIWMVF